MTVDQLTSAQRANFAQLAKMVDAVRPIVDAFQEIADRVVEGAAKALKLVADRLAPVVAQMASSLRSLSPAALELARHWYENVLAVLEKVPGAQPVVRVLRWGLDSVFGSSCRRIPKVSALVVSARPSLASSPRYLVSRSSRRLRGPSLALCAQHHIQGASLT